MLYLLMQSDQIDNNGTSEISAHALVECVMAICSGKELHSEDAQAVALAALLPAHHPAIVAISSDLWVKVVKRFGLDPHNFVSEQQATLKAILVDSERISPVSFSVFFSYLNSLK